jgi:hypothetical protein
MMNSLVLFDISKRAQHGAHTTVLSAEELSGQRSDATVSVSIEQQLDLSTVRRCEE